MFQICGTIPLFTENNFSYQGIAFDGCCYYLTAKNRKKISKLDKCLKLVEDIPVGRVYSSICYDSTEKCFWATSCTRCHGIYKLNEDLKEVSLLRPEPFCGVFSCVAYCCKSNSLLVSIGDKIIHINKLHPENADEIKHCQGAFITGVTCISPCYIYYFIKDEQQVRVISEDGAIIEEFTPPEGDIIQQMLYCGRDLEYDYFKALTLKQGCYPYLLELRLPRHIMGNILPCNKICCGCHGDCTAPCDECECCPPRPPYNGCNDILESIALVEAAIAHILNAEGEKIQKAVAIASCTAELLAVNEEVNRTIIYVTQLEQVLYSKLEAAQKCYCPIVPPCNDCTENECGIECEMECEADSETNCEKTK
ncbi:MAG: hypothetical protein RSA45_07325 [Hydrogenoanaerobacterium sp.]